MHVERHFVDIELSGLYSDMEDFKAFKLDNVEY